MNVMIKPASGQCNMSCDYCFYCDEMRRREQQLRGMMSEQTLKNVIRRTMSPSREPMIYAWQGGEPLLRGLPFFEKALSYQQQYNRYHLPVRNALQTNGTLLNDEWCAFFAENHFLVGVSVDGSRLLHDRYRHMRDGSASFERVMRGIDCLEKWKVDYNILTVVTKDLAENIDEVYAFYAQKGWKYQQYIACLDPEEAASGPEAGAARFGDSLTQVTGTARAGYSLTPDVYGRFLVRLFELWDRDRALGREPYIRQFDNYVGILMGYQPESCEQQGRCGLQYAVEADGSVYPCDFYMTDEYLLGNLNEDRLTVIDQRREEIGFIAASEKLPPRCRSCEHLKLCRGGCRRNREENEDMLNRFCESYRMLFESEAFRRYPEK